MKRYFPICILLLLSALILLTGCHHINQGAAKHKAAMEPSSPIWEENDLSANYYYLESRIHIKNEDFKKAQASLYKALAKDPDSFVLTRELIALFMREKNKDKAIEQIDHFTRRNPDNVDGLLLMVQLKKETLDEAKLVEILNRILAVDPDNKESYLRLGKIYIDKKDYPAALTLFQKMVQQFPDYYVGQFYLGDVHMSLKQYEQAQERFLKSIELEPDLVAPRLQLIDIYNHDKKKGYEQKVIDTYEQILTIEPDNYSALFSMALAYYKAGQKDKASEIFTQLGGEADSNSRLIMAATEEFISGKKQIN